MKNFTIALFLGIVQGLDETNLPVYDTDLKCGDCIRSGHVFCVHGADSSVSYDSVPDHNCIQESGSDSDQDLRSNLEYSCSDTFGDMDYAVTMCPQRQKACGLKQALDFSSDNASEHLDISGLKQGETCTFKIRSNCGSPNFRMKDETSDAAAGKVSISYVEFNANEIEDVDMSTQETSIADRGEKAPDGGSFGGKRPPRDQNFESEDDEADKQGPPGKGGGKGKGGRGKPSKGEYDPSADKGDYHTFGSEGTGTSKEGYKESGSGNCGNREMYVTITATEDLEDTENILLEMGSYTFAEDGAMYLKAASALAAMYTLF